MSNLSYPDPSRTVSFVAVSYFGNNIKGKDPIKSHGNATIPISLSRPYNRTSKTTLQKSDELLSKGLNVRDVYTNLSGGPLNSQPQGLEAHNIKQIRNRKASLNKNEGDLISEDKRDEISSGLSFKDSYPGYVSIQDDDYIIFLATNKQIEDIRNFCCRGKSVLSVDTTFNLCDL